MTPEQMHAFADALDCFWNASIGSARQSQDATAMAVAGALSEGFAAMAHSLREALPEKESRAEIERLRARIAALDAALEPFAEVGAKLPDDRVLSDAHPEWERCMRRFGIASSQLLVRHFRRACEARDG